MWFYSVRSLFFSSTSQGCYQGPKDKWAALCQLKRNCFLSFLNSSEKEATGVIGWVEVGSPCTQTQRPVRALTQCVQKTDDAWLPGVGDTEFLYKRFPTPLLRLLVNRTQEIP